MTRMTSEAVGVFVQLYQRDLRYEYTEGIWDFFQLLLRPKIYISVQVLDFFEKEIFHPPAEHAGIFTSVSRTQRVLIL